VEGTPFGRYRLVELLGHGGTGEVWRAFDTATDRVVALKVLPANFAEDQRFRERFRREATAAAGLVEPHVIPIYDFGEIEGRLFVNMRLIQGRDLRSLLGRGSLAPNRAVGITGQIAAALQAAHQIGLVHGDVRPSNILVADDDVADDDVAYLIDFGIARVAAETEPAGAGASISAWAYMAPERFQKGTVDARADIYALACVLHECLTGQPPFAGDTLEQIAFAHMRQPPPRPSELRDGIPAAMDHVVAAGLAKDPEQRYATTEDLAHAALAALPTVVRQTSRSTPSATRVRVAATPPEQPARADMAQGDASTTSGGGSVTSSEDTAKATEIEESIPDASVLQDIHTAAKVSMGAAPPPASAGNGRPGESGSTLEATPSTEQFVSQRQDRRNKVAAGAGALLLVVVGIAVVVIVLGNRPPSGAGSASSTSTTNVTGPSPPASPMTTESTTPSISPPDRLRAMLPTDLRCKVDTGRFADAPVSIAQAVCPYGGPDLIRYWLFADKDTMYRSFNKLNKGLAETFVACPGMREGPQDWQNAADPQQSGKVTCSAFPSPVNFIRWTIDSQLVMGSIGGEHYGQTSDQLLQWWRAHYE
jgi:serine/threonine protein kinase